MTERETISLREHFDEKFAEMKDENAKDHAAVLKRLDNIEQKLSVVVTWPALGTALLVAAAVIGAVFAFTDHF